MPSFTGNPVNPTSSVHTNPDKVTIIAPDADSDGRWVDYFEVKIDGKTVMEGINGGTKEVDVVPGDHKIEATIRWRYSIGGSRGEMKHSNVEGYLEPGSVIKLELIDNKAIINIS